ncbi:Glycosyl hydrolase family 30 TIM-barrel domain [Trinorchestia longiramus]|nr:Glycosyl hydrolase family 30 TIM-barrel domain [Trinorchestia longiramus]
MATPVRHLLLSAALVVISYSLAVNGHCVERTFGHDSFVCVCNATCCEEPGIISVPESGTYSQFSSARSMYRMEPFSGEIEAAAGDAPSVSVDTSTTFQAILGFGGAFTDSVGINIDLLSPDARQWLLRSYWAPEGAEYSIGRIPIGGCDMSTRPYTLDDVEGDVELVHWSLAPEDFNYKIPYVKEAMAMSEQEVLIFGSPWTPPIWMKSNNMFNGTGYLLREYYQPYANYIVKWVAAYESEGVPIWGLTPQNEPLDQEEDWENNGCVWHPEDMRDWIRDFLGPSLSAAGYGRLSIMADDFNRYTLPYYVEPCFADPECSQYVDGVAVHWYADDTESPEILLETRALDPSKFILYSESCNGLRVPFEDGVMLGDWARGERYLYNILEDINYYSVGWVDWNQALNMIGGPLFLGNALDSPIIVNGPDDEFYMQPMHFALTHVSKFFKRGDLRIDAVPDNDNIKAAAVLKEDGSVAVVVLNMPENCPSTARKIARARPRKLPEHGPENCPSTDQKTARARAKKLPEHGPKNCPSTSQKIARARAKKLPEQGPKNCPSKGQKTARARARKLPEHGPENCPSTGQKTARARARKLPEHGPENCPSTDQRTARARARKLPEHGPENCPSTGQKIARARARELPEHGPENCPSTGQRTARARAGEVPEQGPEGMLLPLTELRIHRSSFGLRCLERDATALLEIVQPTIARHEVWDMHQLGQFHRLLLDQIVADRQILSSCLLQLHEYLLIELQVVSLRQLHAH